jgi:hypothetical protein
MDPFPFHILFDCCLEEDGLYIYIQSSWDVKNMFLFIENKSYICTTHVEKNLLQMITTGKATLTQIKARNEVLK